MDYITYLKINKLIDNANNFINYLIEIKDYTKENASYYVNLFY